MEHPFRMHQWDPVCSPAQVTRPVRIDPSGRTGPTKAEAAGRYWRQTSRGLYVPLDVDSDVPEQRIVEQAMRLPAGGAVTGWAGLRLHRVGLVDGVLPDGVTRMPVPLLVPGGGLIRKSPDVLLVNRALPKWELQQRYGVPTACLVRCAFDAVRLTPDEREGLVTLEMTLASRLVSPERLAAYTRTHAGEHGVGRVRRALARCSEGSRSPNETRLRLVWEDDARLPGPEVNVPILGERGELLGIADLLSAEVGLAVEFDGRDHRGRRRHAKDVRKQEAFLAHGLHVARVTGTDLRAPGLVVDRLLSAYARASSDPRRQRWHAGEPGPSIEEEVCGEEELAMLRREIADQHLPDVSGW